jgi:hypothetical protein
VPAARRLLIVFKHDCSDSACSIDKIELEVKL